VPVIDTKAGKVELSATIIDPVTSAVTAIHGSTQTVTFVAGPPVPTAPLAPPGTGSMLSVTQNFRVADGTQVDSVMAHITDKYGNPVAGAPVTFSITAGGTATSGAALVGSVTVATDANGNIEIAITSTVPGTVFINGALNLTNLVDGSSQTVTFDNAPDVNNPQTQLIVVVYEAIADGTSTTVVKAHIVDQGGNIMVGQDVTFAIDSGTAQIITPQPVPTDANGDAFISITSTKTGFVLITATVGGKAIIFGSPARVKFVPINIYVPRVFTPNNDGTNDVLKPILVGIATFHYFNIYNRWGNLIFTTQDPTRGWDGTFKGVAQPVETYLWIAEGIDIEGKKIVQKGMTSLVR
jgi:gliding motility-associated-like protein